MVVVSMTDCPAKLRGDLSKWLCEINTGVYVGNVSSRVRDELWRRICENLRTGRATMVFSAAGEQHMDFRVHNTTWEPVDFDGIKLMRRPVQKHFADSSVRKEKETIGSTKEISEGEQKSENCYLKRTREDYVVIDIETTGLSVDKDVIIELAALRVSAGKPIAEFSTLIQSEAEIPDKIIQLTGITNEQISKKGREMSVALRDFLAFVGEQKVVCHNASFDYAFLQSACKKNGIPEFVNPCIDTLLLARRRISEVKNYKLSTLAEYFSITVPTAIHRALADCYLTYGIYTKLNKI